jgi:hypothetical protein
LELVILTWHTFISYALIGTLAKLSPRRKCSFLTKPPYVISIYPYLISPKDTHLFKGSLSMWRMHASMHMLGAATISMAGFPSSLISQLKPTLDIDWPRLGVTGLHTAALMKKSSLHAIRSATKFVQMRRDSEHNPYKYLSNTPL